MVKCYVPVFNISKKKSSKNINVEVAGFMNSIFYLCTVGIKIQFTIHKQNKNYE
jgi:hypothetical protein